MLEGRLLRELWDTSRKRRHMHTPSSTGSWLRPHWRSFSVTRASARIEIEGGTDYNRWLKERSRYLTG